MPLQRGCKGLSPLRGSRTNPCSSVDGFDSFLDGWPSGLRRTPGKRVGMQMSRGFKSHPVRTQDRTITVGIFTGAFAASLQRALAARRLERKSHPVRNQPLGGVAERQCTGLENRRPQGLKGSNPFPSASPPIFSPCGCFSRLRRKKGLALLDGESLPLRFPPPPQGFSPCG